MDQDELSSELRRRGVDASRYYLASAQQSGTRATSADPVTVLHQDGCDWVVTIYERGDADEMLRVESEDAACRWLLTFLTRGAAAPAAPQLSAEGLADYQRRAAEQRAYWNTVIGAPPSDGPSSS